MTQQQPTSAHELQDLRSRLEEAEATLDAIRNGRVDALVVATPQGAEKVYTLAGAEYPYRVLIEAMQQGAVTLGSDSTVVYCNQSFASMVERPQEQVIGTSFLSFIAHSNKSLLKDILRNRSERNRTSEVQMQRVDGSLIPVSIALTQLPLEDGLAVIVIVTDLTRQRQYQELQEVNRRKDEFLAMLAHELRNPLAPIVNAVQVLQLRNGSHNSDVQWACEVVDRQVQQMTRIVDDLLDVSRITRGTVVLHMKPRDVSAVVMRAIETSRPIIQFHKHTLTIVLHSESLTVEADETRLAQAITNLLNNAAKYTEQGGTIWISTEREGSDVLIRVRDTGVGLTPEMLPKVFDLFTQVERSIDRSQGGLGIGLTLVRSLLQLHRGSVSATSPGAGQGSEFVLRLPLLVELPSTFEHLAEDTFDCAPQRILVVDDNQDSATSLSMLLEMEGHQTFTCFDGQSALNAAQDFEPTVILLDIALPGMNGFKVAEQLRQQTETRDVILIAVTGYGADEDRRHSKEVGFDHHLVKPITYPMLQKLLGTAAASNRPEGHCRR